MFVEESSHIKRKSFSLRKEVRNLALNALSWWHVDINHETQLFSKPRIQFLYVHHVFNDEMSALEKLMSELGKKHHFISYSDAVNKILQGEVDKPYICISSDDGLKNNLRAAEVLNNFGVKACFFICPSIIGEKDKQEIAKFCNNRLHFPPVEFLSWKEVETLQKWGHEIGGHTISHVNLAETSRDEMHNEIGDCYKVLLKECGEVKHFAYPYGRYHHFNNDSRNMAFDYGFVSFASAERGCHIVEKGQRTEPRDLLIRRDHVILNWPLKHILYFLCGNARKASVNNNYFP